MKPSFLSLTLYALLLLLLSQAGLSFALEYIHAEDLHTNYVDIGPVNKARVFIV